MRLLVAFNKNYPPSDITICSGVYDFEKGIVVNIHIPSFTEPIIRSVEEYRKYMEENKSSIILEVDVKDIDVDLIVEALNERYPELWL